MSKLFNDWLLDQMEMQTDWFKSQYEKEPTSEESSYEPIITNYLINDNE